MKRIFAVAAGLLLVGGCGSQQRMDESGDRNTPPTPTPEMRRNQIAMMACLRASMSSEGRITMPVYTRERMEQALRLAQDPVKMDECRKRLKTSASR